jgi:acyl-CoA synthetase (AMP-forming)/AMP-acid ligase II/enoyl-CoA hydratase/carnithine racemase
MSAASASGAGATSPPTPAWHPPFEAGSVAELLARRAALTPHALFCVDEHRTRLTFAELSDAVDRAAAGLVDLAVGPGDLVSWQLPNRISTIVLSLALCRLGVAQNPLVMLLQKRDLAFVCAQAGTTHLFVPGEFRGTDHAAMGHTVAATVPGLAVHVVDPTAPLGPVAGALPEGDPSGLPARRTDGPGDVRWIFYTSGTTADPKGAKHTDRGLIAASDVFCANVAVTEQDQTATLLPLAHIGGTAHVLTALRTGSSLVTSATFDPAATIDLLVENRITLLGSGFPFIRAYLARQREQPDRPLFSHVRATLCGGAGRPPALHEQVRRELGGVGVVSGYGMTECPYLTWATPEDDDSALAIADGRAGPGVEIRVLRTDGSPAEHGEEGELRVRGPQLMLGYVDRRLDDEAFDEHGFFRTGDLGILSPGGGLTVTGRIKDVIIRKMENISAREVEDHLADHPGIADVAVIGLPDEDTGERACAVVVPSDPAAPPGLESLVEHLAAHGLSNRKFPERLEVVDQLPRNSLGKLVKRDLQARFGPEATAAPRSPDSATENPAAPSPHPTVRRPLGDLSTIVLEVDAHVATVTLNRPDRLNSFNQTMTEEIAAVWGQIRDDDDVHVVVLRAAGDRAFCTGLDVREGPWWSDENLWNQEDPGVLLGPKQHRLWKPMIAAVHGMAAGGGMYFVNEADVVVCSDDATFFDPHADGGMVSALEPMGMLRRGVPLGDVLRWALAGSTERITADTALRLGLVTEVLPRDRLWAAARGLAEEIAGRRPAAIQGTVRAIWESLDLPPSIAARHGMSYAHLGNRGRGELRPSGGEKRFR